MQDLMVKMSVKLYLLKDALQDEKGQDLIEHALLIAFVAFAATAGMTALATKINAAFSTIGTDLSTAIA